MNKTKENWNDWSDKWYAHVPRYVEQIILRPELAIPKPIVDFISKKYDTLKGLKVCVPSSGDNLAAFAFHLMGAQVTSLDLSERQIENAKKIAEEKDWPIDFYCEDSMTLGQLKDKTFDLVYTSNGVHVWISDLVKMYSNIKRVLKPGGSYICFDTHPMTRPFDMVDGQVVVKKAYSDTGPFVEDGLHEYAWRTEDYLMSMVEAGLTIKAMVEFTPDLDSHISYDYMYDNEEERNLDGGRAHDWQSNPWAAIPQCIGFHVTKS